MVTDGAPKKKKKRKKKASKARSASSSTSSSASSQTSKKKVTRKKKKRPSSRAAESKPARSARAEAQKAEAEGSSPMMMIGIVVAVAVVGGYFLMSGDKKEGTEAKPDGSAAVAASGTAQPAAANSTRSPIKRPKPKGPPAPPDVAAPPADAEKTESGLASKVLKKGTGDYKPGTNDSVKVHYSGWTKDGNLFDSSVGRGKPTTFGVTQVIKGWTEGLQLMVVGEKRRFWIPGNLAYGEKARGGRPAGQLTFDVELLDIIKAPEVPKDLKEPPKDAKKTKSGLVYTVLQKVDGDAPSPTEADRVEVHYTGWQQSDGKMFDSSVSRGKTTKFGLKGVIKGWTEGLQLMKVGEKFRFWIPGDLAYGDKPSRGRPGGTLVFDVELVSIVGGAKAAPAASASASTSAKPKEEKKAPKPSDAPKPAAPAPKAPKPKAPKPAAPKPAAPKPVDTPYD